MVKPLYECSRPPVDRHIAFHRVLVPIWDHHVCEDVGDSFLHRRDLVRGAVRELDGVEVPLRRQDVLCRRHKVVTSLGGELIPNWAIPEVWVSQSKHMKVQNLCELILSWPVNYGTQDLELVWGLWKMCVIPKSNNIPTNHNYVQKLCIYNYCFC